MDSIRPEPEPEAADSSSDFVRTYKVWEGNNVFGLKGRLIFGPDARSLLLSILMIVVPAAVFCVFVASKLMDDFPHHLGISIMVVFILLNLFVLIVLLLTSGRDPGIIPRYSSSPEMDNFDGIVRVMNSQGPQMQKPPTKEVFINGISVKIKYCDTCKLYRPPRCSHCSICDNCVERFDHHCPWVGQCIGLRNYRFYFMLVFCATLLCLYVFGFCWVYVKRIMDGEEVSVWKALVKTPASIVLIIYTFLLIWFVGGLTVFHSYLIGTNQTTYENFRYHYDRRDNPFHKGVIGNFKEVFFSSIPPSKNRFRAKIPKRSEYPSRRVDSGVLVGQEMGKAAGDLETGIKPIWDDLLRGEGSYGGDMNSVDEMEKSGELATEIVELKQASSRKAPHMSMLSPLAFEEDLHTPKIGDTDSNR